METINLNGLKPDVAAKVAPFFEAVLQGAHAENIHSIHVVGSALTTDFNPKVSLINSVIVLKEMDLGFVEFLAPLGNTYKKKGIAAPLTMTPSYIDNSLDVFPIEFLDFKLLHETVFGTDIMETLVSEPNHLRLQCEREVKAKLIWLRQGYISSLGDKSLISERLSDSIVGYMPLFRAVITLLGEAPPVLRRDVISALQRLTGIETKIFEKMLLLRRGELKLSKKELTESFEQYYRATERTAKLIDELTL